MLIIVDMIVLQRLSFHLLCSQRKVDEFFALSPCALYAAGCYTTSQAHRTGLKIDHFDFIDIHSLSAMYWVVATFEIVFQSICVLSWEEVAARSRKVWTKTSF